MSDVPKALAVFLVKLTSLNLMNNNIGKLPNNLGRHKNIKNLQVDGNPLKSIRRAVIDRGTAGLLQYLSDKYIEDVDGGVEDWAISKDTRPKKVSYAEPAPMYYEEEKLYKPKYPNILINAGLETINDKTVGYVDNISEMSHVHTEEPHEKSYGKVATHMYSELGKQQKDDFFWKGHQQRVEKKYVDPNEHIFKSDISEVQSIHVPEVRIASETVDKKALVHELKILDSQIRVLINDIDNNFSLSKRDIQVKRKDLHKIQSRRNYINSMLAE